jgi:hypothetical protein
VFSVLGGLTFMGGTPLGFILSLLGVVLNKGRRAGIVGLAVSAILVVWFFFAALC